MIWSAGPPDPCRVSANGAACYEPASWVRKIALSVAGLGSHRSHRCLLGVTSNQSGVALGGSGGFLQGDYLI